MAKKYTLKDLEGILPQDLTETQRVAVEAYINDGIIPPADPCLACEPNVIRRLISTVQVAERNGLFPPKTKAKPKPAPEPEPEGEEESHKEALFPLIEDRTEAQ